VLESGIHQLDALLGGGLDRGTSSLLIGPAGSGKSSLASHFAACAAEKGEKSAIFIFDEIRENYIKRATGLGTKIENYINAGLINLKQIDQQN
jgi:circadian clock protein KaiC